MKPRPENERALAESLFVCDGKSSRQIAAILHAGTETVQRWSREGKWAERRRQRRLDSPLAALERLKRERDRLIRTLGAPPAAPDSKDPLQNLSPKETIDAVHKLTQTIERIEDSQGAIEPMLEGTNRFANFVAAHADDAALAVLRTWMEKFLDDERRKCIQA